MREQNSIAYQNKLKRLRRQLSQSEQLLQNHPLLKGKWAILQILLRRFNWQMQWSMAGPSSRLSMTLQTALYAQGTEQSQTGFMGPTILQIQELMKGLIQVSLKSNEKELASLIVNMMQLIAISAIFIATQLIEKWKTLIPQHEDSVSIAKSGWLLREMGLNFLLGSRAIESAFCSIGKGMELNKESQKKMTDIGICFSLTLLILLHENDTAQEESFIETVKHFLEPTLPTIKQALEDAEMEQLVEKEQIKIALNQLEIIHQTLNKGTRTELKQILSTSFDMLGMSLQAIKQDVERISVFCAQINKNFKNIFERNPMNAIQAA